jgi:hypothetical protein
MSFKNFKGAVFSDDRGFLRFVNDFDFSDVKRFYREEKREKDLLELGMVTKKKENMCMFPREQHW